MEFHIGNIQVIISMKLYFFYNKLSIDFAFGYFRLTAIMLIRTTTNIYEIQIVKFEFCNKEIITVRFKDSVDCLWLLYAFGKQVLIFILFFYLSKCYSNNNLKA